MTPGDERQLPAAPRRREPRPPLVDDPCLNTALEELDLELGAGTAEAYLAPPPLIARLAVPRSHGRWTRPLPADAVPAPDIDPITETHLGDLDEELPDESAEAESFDEPPPLMAQLPGPTGFSARHAVSDWMVSVTLILLMFAGAAAGALVFRERLSDIVVQWEARLR